MVSSGTGIVDHAGKTTARICSPRSYLASSSTKSDGPMTSPSLSSHTNYTVDNLMATLLESGSKKLPCEKHHPGHVKNRTTVLEITTRGPKPCFFG